MNEIRACIAFAIAFIFIVLLVVIPLLMLLDWMYPLPSKAARDAARLTATANW